MEKYGMQILNVSFPRKFNLKIYQAHKRVNTKPILI